MKHLSRPMARTVIGLDLGDRFSYFFAIDRHGEMLGDGRLRTTPEALGEYFGRVEPTRIAIEAGTHSPWVSRLLEEAGHEVLVANPRQLALISQSSRKCDRLDAEQLARLARTDPKLLAPIRHRGVQAQAGRSVLRIRDTLVRARSRLVAAARSTVKAFGARLPSCSTESFHKKVGDHLPDEVAGCLRPLLEVIGLLTEKIRRYDRQLEKISEEQYPETARLAQVPGVGPVTALAYVLTIEDPRRFPRRRKVGSYLGLVPRRDESGQRSPQLRITKEGDDFLRRLLVQCAQYILGPHGPDTDLKRWGLKLCERGGKNAKKRAVVAVARRLSVLLLALWVNGKTYERLRTSKPREARAAQAASSR